MWDLTGFGTQQNATYGATSQSVKILWLQYKWKVLFQGLKLWLKFSSTNNNRNICGQHAPGVHYLAHERYCQLMMEQLPAHSAWFVLCPPKRCFLPSAESCTEHGSVLQMAAPATRVVKAAESIALVFQKRLMTRDPCYFIGMFQQLSPWAVFYIYLFTEKWCTISSYTSEQNAGIKSEKIIS